MRKAIRQKWTSLSGYSGSSSSTDIPASSGTESSSTYTRDSVSSYSSSTELSTRFTTSPFGVTTTSASPSSVTATSSAETCDRAPTFSAASGCRTSSSKSSKNGSCGVCSSSEASRSLFSSSDALVGKPKSEKDQKDSEEKSGTAPEGHSIARSLSAATTTTTTNDVTVDDVDALVQRPSPSLQRRGSGNLAGVSSASASSSPIAGLELRAVDAASALPSSQLFAKSLRSLDFPAPVSPYHFSEEELARQPWIIENDATTHTSEEGGLAFCAADVLGTIHTVPVEVPPSPEMAQRRRQEGGLLYPSHLTYRVVLNAPGDTDAGADGAAGGGGNTDDATKENEGKSKLGTDVSSKGRVKKTVCDTCCDCFSHRKREEQQRKAEERAAARQKSYHDQLHSHHVPLVSFRTTRDPNANLMDGDNTLPTVEEAADYRHHTDDMQGAEVNPKKLEKAMRQRRRPASGLHWKTKYAFGRRAGGGPRGIGESAFVREGDPQRFWIAQLHERPQVRLEAIETE